MPYPVDSNNYDETIKFLKKMVDKMRLGFAEKINRQY